MTIAIAAFLFSVGFIAFVASMKAKDSAQSLNFAALAFLYFACAAAILVAS